MLELSLTLTQDDWLRYQSYVERELPKHLPKPWSRQRFRSTLAISCVMALIFLVMFAFWQGWHWPTAINLFIVTATMFTLMVMELNRFKQSYLPSDQGPFVGEHHFVFDEKGITASGQGYRSFHEWVLVKRIDREQGLVLIFLDTALAFVLPEEKLQNPDEVYDTLVQLKAD